jgi:hypothetical protein
MSTGSDYDSIDKDNISWLAPPSKGEWYRVARVVSYAVPLAEHSSDIRSLRELEKLNHAFRERLRHDCELRSAFIRRLKAYRGTITEEQEAFEWNESTCVIVKALLNRASFEIAQKQDFARKVRFVHGLMERKVALKEMDSGLRESYSHLTLYSSKSGSVKEMKTMVWNSLKETVDIAAQGPVIVEK